MNMGDMFFIFMIVLAGLVIPLTRIEFVLKRIADELERFARK